MAIEVATAADLNNVRNNLSGDYIQVANIDLSGYGSWTPIGEYDPVGGNWFTGTYNGGGYTISNLNVGSAVAENIGL